MTFTNRLCVFAAIALACAIAWQCSTASESSHEITQLAVRQFQNDASVPVNLQQASLAQNWWPLLFPALMLMLGVVVFWEEVERRWKCEE
jgi:GAF domain-containing protein